MTLENEIEIKKQKEAMKLLEVCVQSISEDLIQIKEILENCKIALNGIVQAFNRCVSKS